MGEQDERLDVLADEVRALRTQVKRMRMVGVGVLALAFLGGAAASGTLVQAQRFELVDRAGDVRAVLSMDGDTPFLEMRKEGRTQRWTVDDTPEAGSLSAKVRKGVDDPSEVPSWVDMRGRDGVDHRYDRPDDQQVTMRLVGDEARHIRKARVDCPHRNLDLIQVDPDGVLRIEHVPAGQTCRVTLQGLPMPVKTYVRAGTDVTCTSENKFTVCY